MEESRRLAARIKRRHMLGHADNGLYKKENPILKTLSISKYVKHVLGLHMKSER